MEEKGDSMEKRQVIDTIKNHLYRQFPKTCSSCGKRYPTLAIYIKQTTHVGKPISYDAQANDWKPQKPVGSMSLSNCECGSSLSLDSRGMGVFALWRLMAWARKQAKSKGVEVDDVLADLRKEIDDSVLKDEKSRR